MNTTRKNDTKEERDEFEIIKDYVLNCPLVGSGSPAIKAAIEGIEKEQKRRIRDAKLRSKFGGGATNNNSNCRRDNRSKSAVVSNSSSDDGDEIVVVEKIDADVDTTVILAGRSGIQDKDNNDNNDNDDDDDMEWQDVREHQRDVDVDTMGVAAAREIGDSFTTSGDSDTSQLNNSSSDDSFLGRTLARACIDAIARQETSFRPVLVSTPLSAIAVALHASLRSDVLGFACTGVPEETKKGKGIGIGFAPPVRELSKSEFLPSGWDTQANNNANNSNSNQSSDILRSPDPLRYRKMDTGAVILTVKGQSSNEDGGGDPQTTTECKVTFAPANSKEDSSQYPSLKFPLSEHINLDSWNAALAGGKSKIHPSLHYKNLSGLLSKFCRTFDLGAVNRDSVEDDSGGNNSNTNKAADLGISRGSTARPNVSGVPSGVVYPVVHPPTAKHMSSSAMELGGRGHPIPSTVYEAFPSAAAAARRSIEDPLRVIHPPGYHGDFSGDLLPAGSGLRPSMQGNTGNLMGPHHPLFASGQPSRGVGGLPIGGPGTMRPRFDPLLPPGIGGDDGLPQPPGRSSLEGGRRRHTPGEPNPDHLPPPNSFGGSSSSMFL